METTEAVHLGRGPGVPEAKHQTWKISRNDMPTYEYKCTVCDNHFDVEQSITEDSLTSMPGCESTDDGEHQLKKVFSAVGISFKGDGFYRNDSRSGSSASSSSTGSSTSSGDSSNGSSSSSTSSDSSSSDSSDSSSSSSSSSSDSSKKKKSDAGSSSSSSSSD